MQSRSLWTVLLLLLITTLTTTAQNTTEFRTGYIVTKAGDSIDCKINAIRWPNIPSRVDYRVGGDQFSIQRDAIAEIVITNRYKHVRHLVDMDRSTTAMDALDDNKELNLEKANLLLEVLVEGPATLYFYRKTNMNRLFFSVDDDPVKQLIYKLYRKENGDLGANLGYKQQLWEELKCEDLSLTAIGELEYDHREITTFFRKYNDCKSSVREGFDRDARTRVLFASVIAGPHFGNFHFQSAFTPGRTALGNVSGVSFGLDLEYVFGTRNSSWSAYATPMYHSSSASYQTADVEVELNYNMLKLPIGFRYSVLQSGNPKGHIDLGLVFSIEGGASLTLVNEPEEPIDVTTGLGVGAGINITKRLYARTQYIAPTKVQKLRDEPEIYYGYIFVGLAYRLNI